MTSNPKNSLNKRPLSPHLSIYKLPITAITSILHRISGVALFIGVMILCLWIMENVYGCKCYNAIIASDLGQFFMFLWSLALFYHMLNGIRYLFWISGKGMEIGCARKSGAFVFLGAAILSSLVFYISKVY